MRGSAERIASMHRRLWLVLVLLAANLWPSHAHGQAGALVFHARGGRLAVLKSLGPDGDKLRAGLVVGGGLGIQFTPNLVLRGSVLRTDNEYRGPTLQVTDSTFRRLFLGVDLQVGVSTQTGLAPYFSIGAGQLRLSPEDASLDDFSRFVGTLGAGLNYVVNNFPLVFFTEMDTWLYRFSGLGFNRQQVDLLFLAGLAVAVPL